MNKKTIVWIAVTFTVVGLILNNLLQTTVGAYLMTLSFLACVVGVTGILYYMIKFNIMFLRSKRKRRKI